VINFVTVLIRGQEFPVDWEHLLFGQTFPLQMYLLWTNSSLQLTSGGSLLQHNHQMLSIIPEKLAC
jgi:hypothetical protein